MANVAARAALIALTLTMAAGCKRPATKEQVKPDPTPPVTAVPIAAAEAPATIGPPCSNEGRAPRDATTPDGKTTVFVHVDARRQDATATGETDHEDLCIHREGQAPRVLLHGRPMPKVGDFQQTLVRFDNFVFSADGQTLYFTSDTWVTSSAAHSVDLRTGRERFLTDGAIDHAIESGPHKGQLLASHFRIVWKDVDGSPESQGRQHVWSIITTSGKAVMTLEGEGFPIEKWTGESSPRAPEPK